MKVNKRRLIAKGLFPIAPRKSIWCFLVSKRQPWCGNLKAVCDYVVRQQIVPHVCIINAGITSNEIIYCQYKQADIKLDVVNVGTRDAFNSIRLAEVSFVSHSDYTLPGPVINLWHGIPFKKIELATQKKRRKKYDMLISSSETDRFIMAACFGMNPADVLNTGLPRNDWLTGKVGFPPEYNTQIADLTKFLKGKKLALYAPTFRDENKSQLPMSNRELERLSETLDTQGYVLGIRPHPNVTDEAYKKIDNILDLAPDQFPEMQVLLFVSDLLITDYSSSAIDFSLTGRPCISYSPDMEEYSRGFLYNFDHAFPGKRINCFEDLRSEIIWIDVEEKKTWFRRLAAEKRCLFHDERKGSSTKLVVENVMKKVSAN